MDHHIISTEQHPDAVDRGFPLPPDVMDQTQVSENACDSQVASEISFDSFSGSSLFDSIGDSSFGDLDEMPTTHNYLDMELNSPRVVQKKFVGDANCSDEKYPRYTDPKPVAIDEVRETFTDPFLFRDPQEGPSEYANEPTRLEMTVDKNTTSHMYIDVTSGSDSEMFDVELSGRCAVEGEASVTDHDKTDGEVKFCVCGNCKMNWNRLGTNANSDGRALVEKLECIESAHSKACSLPQNGPRAKTKTNSSQESREGKGDSPRQREVQKRNVSPKARHFYCNVCLKPFKEKIFWVQHWHKHTTDANFGKLQHDAYGPVKSSRKCDTSMDPKAHACKICRMPLVFERGTSDALFADLVDMHSHCMICLKRYLTPQGLQNHMKVHLRENSAEILRYSRPKTNYAVIKWMNPPRVEKEDLTSSNRE